MKTSNNKKRKYSNNNPKQENEIKENEKIKVEKQKTQKKKIKKDSNIQELQKHLKFEKRIISESEQDDDDENEIKEKEEESKKFKCDECEKSYTNQGTLNRHKNIHDTNIPERTCKYCLKVMKNKSDLPRHIKHRCPKVIIFTSFPTLF